MNVLVIGAGGHARVVLDILLQLPHEVVGIIDDDSSKAGTTVAENKVIGTSENLAELFRRGRATGAIVAIGNNESRLKMARQLENLGYELITAVHPSAVLGSRVSVGRGTVIMAGVIVNCDVLIEENVILNTGATVDHDCWLGIGCHVSPGAHIAGNVQVGQLANIGIGAAVLPGVRIGKEAFAGAGAVVVRDVPSEQVWVGNPAKPMIEASSNVGQRPSH